MVTHRVKLNLAFPVFDVVMVIVSIYGEGLQWNNPESHTYVNYCPYHCNAVDCIVLNIA